MPLNYSEIRNDWTQAEALELYETPFMNLLYQAHSIHRKYFDPNVIQTSTLISIKTGACPEDCAYCPQSARYKTKIEIEKLFKVEDVIALAKKAKANGATRFCMGAAWRTPKQKGLAAVKTMIESVKKLGMETCVTLGMLTPEQAQELKEAGLDYYNHNLDSSPEFYKKIITTRTYEDRLQTLENVRKAGVKVCCGGIIGMGEESNDRIGLLLQLANLPAHPESVPINLLAKVNGTPLQDVEDLDNFEFIRTVAVARIMMPKAFVRLSAGRTKMTNEMQALCFFAGANSIFYGEEKLLVTSNPTIANDHRLLQKLGMRVLDQDTLNTKYA
jgi:biotin synthase